MSLTKICSKCGKERPVSEFSARPGAKDGLKGRCKECCHRYNADYWASEHGNRMHLASKLKNNFNITLDEYDRMFEKQNGVCLICGGTEGRTYKGVPTRLAVDHDHKTGKVRSLLCYRCNSVLAFVNDDIKLLEDVIDYLEKNF